MMTKLLNRKLLLYLSYFAITLLSVLFISCKDEELLAELTLSTTTITNVAAGGEARAFTITTNTNWTATSDKSWCHLTPTSGVGNTSVVVTIDPSIDPTTRTAIITVTAGNLTGEITVAQVGTMLGLSPSVIAGVSSAGTVTSFDIITNVSWTLSSDQSWCRPAPSAGNGNATVELTIDPNSDASERIALVKVVAGGHTDVLVVKQEKGTITINPTEIAMATAGGSALFTITTSSTWSATSDQAFCRINPTSGNGDATVTMVVDPNGSIVTRTAIITVTGGELSGTVTVTQERAYNRQSDSLALVGLYNAFGMANFTATTKWNLTQPLPASGTATAWPGVRVNAQGRVDSIYFSSGVIPATVTNATIPAIIGDLKELRGFLMSASGSSGKLTGTIPVEFWTLTKLKRLTLSTNNLTGAIPSAIGNLVEMDYLYLNANSGITGPLPREIGNLTKLTALNLSTTGLSGALPDELKKCVKMVDFMMFSTDISSVPDIFNQWPNVRIIQLHKNEKLAGALPVSIGNIVTTATTLSIHLYECNFTGNIPASYANIPTVCGQLRLQTNQLSGTIPDAVKAHSKWSAWTPANYICPQQPTFGFTNCN